MQCITTLQILYKYTYMYLLCTYKFENNTFFDTAALRNAKIFMSNIKFKTKICLK